MKIIFLGTPDFAVPALEKLNNSKHEVIAVVCQPDKPFGRKLQPAPCAVKVFAKSLNLPVFDFENIGKEGAQILHDFKPDIMVTCAYGQMLTQNILNIAPHGIINVHGSLLPKYRGASPVQSAILNGEKVTGVTIMKTVLAMDAGEIILQKEMQILPDETSAELFERMSHFGAEMLLEALDLIEKGEAKFLQQDETKATYCKKLDKKDAVLDFSKTSETLKNIVRAYDGAKCTLFGEDIKVYQTEICGQNGEPGEILFCDGKNGIIIATANSSVRLKTMQLSGKNKMSDVELLRGKPGWKKI